MGIIIVTSAIFSVWWISRPPATPASVLDDIERSVATGEPPKRIVSMAPSATEILFALGVGDKVVGVTDACDYPPEALKIEKIRQPFGDFQIEKIVGLKPDLVVMDRYLDLYPPGKWLSKLEEAKLKAVVLYAKNFDDLLGDISLMGQVTWAQDNATKLVSTLKQKIEAVTGKMKDLSEDNKTRVFCTNWYDEKSDPWTFGYGTFADDVIKMAWGLNVAGIKSGNFQMTLEALVWSDPQVIVDLEDLRWPTPTYDSLLAESRLKGTEAIKNNAIHKMDASLLSRPGPRLVDGLEQMAKLLHPELFP